MNGFGWSFYGFFLFAAAWIAAYFAWARWMEKREKTEPLTRNEHGIDTE
jgi:membrane protein implicated in regulation of membrane protease activity